MRCGSRRQDDQTAAGSPDEVLALGAGRAAADVAGAAAGTGRREPRPRTVGTSPVRPGSAAPVESGGWLATDRDSVISEAGAIVRALRPLHRKTDSRRVGDVVLDEEATADRAVQDDL